ncbi:MAG: ATP-binding cassette domain-containing protein [Betaproteobacteria bacterium]|nr:MAG: ATP-binding cassette domain-containing protein [Betaproteobacteria bacterium]
MILLRNLAIARGPHRLFAGASLSLERGWKIGLVGANGSGKTSLLALLAGELAPEAGDCVIQPGTRIARIEQEAPALGQPVLDYLLDADADLRAAEAAIARAERAGDGHRIAESHERYAQAGGYTAPARAQSVLGGLGFAPGDAQRAVREFSGGFRMRLNLARALLRPSSLLLLDEPTNHLDLDTILWLENWLRGYAGTLLLVSHDRDFLDRATGHTLAIAGGAMRLYTGNYSFYERQRALELEQQVAAAARQDREVQRITAFVQRFRAKATKARQVQSRLKSLEKMARVAPVYATESFHFRFEPPLRQPERIVELADAAAGYDGRSVISGVSLAVTRADRLAVIGVNGAGKTTLVKLLVGELEALAGERRAARDIVIGYFAQHQVELLRPDETPLAMLTRLYRGEREQRLRDFLGRFGFAGERAGRPIGPLSGGEKSRLALAALVKRRPNLLVLDEPTNHLDLEMRRSLVMALQSYEGALVIVAHDRALLSACADRILVVADGGVREFDGDLEDYRQHKLKEARGRRGAPDARPGRKNARRSEAQARDARQKRLRPHLREIEKIEARIAQLTRDAGKARAELADPALYDGAGRSERVKELTIIEARLTEALAQAEDDWLHASARLEAARGETGT